MHDTNSERITLAQGAGGRASQELMHKVIQPYFSNPILDIMHDGAALPALGAMAFTTDSYVVNPRFFPGGNIGKLAVCGTVNDLAMTGAVPKYLSLALILEEGFLVSELKVILATMRDVAKEAQVHIVTGDTKVVGHGAVDGLFINTAGIGVLEQKAFSPQAVQAGMDVIISGTLGDHAATILAQRHGIEVPTSLQSDCAPLANLVQIMRKVAPSLACMRDATRGGVAAVLNEIATAANVGILLEEESLPVREEVQGVVDFLGLDPLELANEGKLVAFVQPEETEALLAAMHEHPYGKQATKIGETTKKEHGTVAMRTALGGIRIVDMPLGAIVPRIC